jgi:hypothetical protein
MDRRGFLLAGVQGGTAIGLASLARAADSPVSGTSSQPDSRRVPSGSVSAPNEILIENRDFRLVLGTDGTARTLVHKPSGQECLQPVSQRCTNASAFSITEYRPYRGEVHLVYPSKSTTYEAASVRRIGDDLVIRFHMSHWVATVGLKVTDSYIGFTLKKLDFDKGFGDNTQHPIDEFNLLQLPVRNRQFFGDWLNVVWDNDVAVNVLATGPHAKIDAQKFKDYALLQATAVREVKLVGVGAALIAAGTDRLLDRIDRLERDFGLPLGVKSRRNEEIRRSYLWLSSVSPKDIDVYIAIARKAGFRGIQIYWPAIFKSLGHYPWRDEYPNGMADLRAIVRKIKEAGMMAGFHIQHPKASINDLYVSPVPDHRLNLVRTFTLAAPLSKDAATITVEESPEGCDLLTAVMWEKKQVLKIGDELVEYARYTTERPYQFSGCKRGALNTRSSAYPLGFKFGLLDIDGQAAVRFDQRTSIQQEHAETIARLSNEAGFQFFSYDGAEDVHAPWWFWVSMSQYEVYKRLRPEPLFATGAAKSHFGWHILTCSNEFDTFAPEVVKEAARKHQAAAGRYLAQDFTRTNLGWIDYVAPSDKTVGMQPDMFEYLCLCSAAWDCPISLKANLEALRAHPRTDDNLEVMRRWEEARFNRFFSREQIEAFRVGGREHTLLIDETGRFELQPYEQIHGAARANPAVRAFVFQRRKQTHIVFWHPFGEADLEMNVDARNVRLFRELGKEIPLRKTAGGVAIPCGAKHYLALDLPRHEALSLFRDARVVAKRT